jgi:hypothetical protein
MEGISLQHELTGTLMTAAGFLPCGGQKILKHPGAGRGGGRVVLKALVTAAAEAQDRIREAQRAIRQYGALVPDRYGALKQNPACFLERDARAGMLSALRPQPRPRTVA